MTVCTRTRACRYDKPLGAPEGDATYDSATGVWSRTFAHASVKFNAHTKVGHVTWGKTSAAAAAAVGSNTPHPQLLREKRTR